MSGINDWSQDYNVKKPLSGALTGSRVRRNAKTGKANQQNPENIQSHLRSEGNVMKGSFLYQARKSQHCITSPQVAENSLKELGFSPSTIKKIIKNNSVDKAIRLYNLGINTGYIKDLVQLEEKQLEKALMLMDTGLSVYSAKQLAKFSDTLIEQALFLKDEGIPELVLADTAAIQEVNPERVDELLNDNQISKYYIAQLAALDDESYASALELIKSYGYSAPSAIDAVRKDDFDFQKAITEKPEKMKKEINIDIEKILMEKAETFYSENAENIEFVEQEANARFGSLTGEHGKLSAREKGINSILNKLISKYEKGDLEIDSDDKTPEEITNLCSDAITDAYGTRLQIDTLNTEKVKEICENKGFDYDTVCSVLQSAIDDNNIKNIPQEYMELVEELKLQQTKPVFDSLLDKIKNDENFNITEINNYGDELSSYFTGDQVKQIFYACYDKNKEKIEIISLDKTFNKDIPEVSYNQDSETFETSSEKNVKKENEVVANFKEKSAIKDSGYTSIQFNVLHKLKNNKTGKGEFQIRSTKVNQFGNAEHIPYDIKQGKITVKDKQYEKIFSVINNMSSNSYKQYNQYLTKVYQSLRMQELGLDVKIPDIDKDLCYKDGTQIPAELINNLTYDSLILYH